MVLHAVNYRHACGMHEHRQSNRDKDNVRLTQPTLNQIATAQRHNLPTTLDGLNSFCLVGAILGNVVLVSSSSAQLVSPGPHNNRTTGLLPIDSLQYVSLPGPLSPSTAPALSPPTLPLRWPRLDFRFPQAAASTLPPLKTTVSGVQNREIIVIDGDEKRQLLYQARAFLCRLKGLDESRMNLLEFKWFQASADAPITLSRTVLEQPLIRSKRISNLDRNSRIAKHIAENCAFEAEIYHPDGSKEGEMLMFKAQRVDNPFRMFYDNIPGYEPSQTVHYVSKTANFVVDIMTFGMKPLFGGMWSGYLRKTYYDMLDDDVCAIRQAHISFANLATTLDPTGTAYKAKLFQPRFKPIELENTVTLVTENAYILKNNQNQVRGSVRIVAKPERTLSEEEAVILVRKDEDAFEAIPMSPTNAKQAKRRVIYDAELNCWHYADDVNKTPLKIELVEGDNFITLYGKSYALQLDKHNQLQIKVKEVLGEEKFLPVYQDPISANWHLANINGHPTYSTLERYLINNYKVEPTDNMRFTAIPTQNPELHGKAILYEVRNRLDDIESTLPLYLLVEMNGALVPARQGLVEGRHIGYSAYNLNAPMRSGQRLEWDSERWHMLTRESQHVSSSLRQQVSEDMFAANLAEHLLSPSDQQGIRWIDAEGYLRVKGQYVPITLGKTPYVGHEEGKQLAVYYKEGQFHPITKEVKKQRSQSIKSEDIQNYVKDLTKDQIKNPQNIAEIQTAVSRLFMRSTVQETAGAAITANNGTLFSKAAVTVKVNPVPSTELDWKRFLFTLGKEDHFFLEISRDGQKVRVLTAHDEEFAMHKYRQTLKGGDIYLAAALTRPQAPVVAQPSSRAEIDAVARERIAAGAALLKEALEKIAGDHAQKKTLLVGHADFFGTAEFENNIFSSADSAYEAMIDILIPLSKQYPETIIVPGSVHISQDIAAPYANNALHFKQGKITRDVNDAINFSTILVPVLHRGKFVAMARKGEFMYYQKPNAAADAPPIPLMSLDASLPRGATMLVSGIKEEPFLELSELNGAKTGTIFTGKTLFPNELERAKWYFCPCPEIEGVERIHSFFSNEFVIDDMKFLLVVEDEFVQREDKRPKVRRLAYPKEEKVGEAALYDWVIHCAKQEKMDDLLANVGLNFIEANRFDGGGFASEVNPRIGMAFYSPDKKMTIYEYIKE